MSFCTKCGKETLDGITVCDECAAKNEIPAEPTNDSPLAAEPESNPVTEAPKVEFVPRETAKKSDLILAAFLLLPCLLTVNAVFFKGIGLGLTLGILLISIITVCYSLKQKKAAPSLYAIFTMILLFLSTISLTLSDNGIIRTLSLGTALILYLTFLVEYFGIRLKKAGTFRAFSDVLEMCFVHGIGNIGNAAFALFRKTDDDGNIEKRKTGNVFAGIALAIPFLLIVVPLLIMSDAAFESLFKNFSAKIVWEIICTVGIGILYFLIVFGRLFSVKFFKKPEVQSSSAVGADPILLISFLGAISSAYIIYLFSQLAYFFSAFSGLLPEDFTTSEYARRGFFEMCAVCAINLFIIFLSTVICRKNEKGLPLGVKGLNVFLCGFSLILIGTALSKMFLYIERYGMTRLRIYTSVFMFFIALVFITVTAKFFIIKVPYMKIILILASAILAVSCIADIDRIIANYNVDAYLSGKLQNCDVRTLGYLNDSATEPILRLYKNANGDVKNDAQAELHNRLLEHFDIETDQNRNNTVTRKNRSILSINITEERAVALLYENREDFSFPITMWD
ncbi:MAG: DUF4173 domain-containing protein [Clostridia bacterium]|nr:DUF4173 domain-containing protein [Clostridia bacterium]